MRIRKKAYVIAVLFINKNEKIMNSLALMLFAFYASGFFAAI